jgi:formylglycine-generating enzyme
MKLKIHYKDAFIISVLVLVSVLTAESKVKQKNLTGRGDVSDNEKVTEKVPRIKKTGTVITIGGIEFVGIKGGCFNMGSNDHIDEKPVHRVCVDSFWMGKYEVTQEQYRAVMGKNPSGFRGSRRPVEKVSWNDAMDFAKKFSKEFGVSVRLPYEAEWEYAARAGTSTKYYWGDSFNDDYAWYSGNSGEKTNPVGRKKPNPWGLYDMSGNVWEWCMDRFDDRYYGKSPERNPAGSPAGKYRILRGGCWDDYRFNLRSSFRYYINPHCRYYDDGFRLVIPTR